MKLHRRGFLARLGAGICAIPVLGGLISSVAQAVQMADPSKPPASALKYVEDATKAVRKDKQDVKGSDQVCDNCNFYKNEIDHEGKKVGQCTMLANKYVTAKGWCNVWSKKV